MTLTAPTDPWTTLGVAPGSPMSHVRAAWRRQVRAWHPDNHGRGDVERFLRAKAAYEAIVNSANSATDATRSTPVQETVTTPPPARPVITDDEWWATPTRQTTTGTDTGARQRVTSPASEVLNTEPARQHLTKVANTARNLTNDPNFAHTALTVAVVVLITLIRPITEARIPYLIDTPLPVTFAAAVAAAAAVRRWTTSTLQGVVITVTVIAAVCLAELAVIAAVPAANVAALITATRHKPTTNNPPSQ